MRQALTAEDAAEALIMSQDATWILKHSSTCSISSAALGEAERYIAEHPREILGVVVVQSARPLSNFLATRLRYTHQSPQLFLLKDGRVRWQASHWGITAEAMAHARQALDAPAG
jgi:bacillithiol system protein YtxJ